MHATYGSSESVALSARPAFFHSAQLSEAKSPG